MIENEPIFLTTNLNCLYLDLEDFSYIFGDKGVRIYLGNEKNVSKLVQEASEAKSYISNALADIRTLIDCVREQSRIISELKARIEFLEST